LFTRNWRPLLFAAFIFAVNAYVCRELFTREGIHNLDSNEGAFVAISRFFREHLTQFPLIQQWFPFFDSGMPIENAYQPVLPLTAAAVGWLTNWSVERAFHFVLALAYCLGPVTLFWFAWEWSGSLVTGAAAGLLYSFTSTAEWLIPAIRVEHEGHWVPLRLYNLLHYAEDPHTAALTLLPVALVFFRRRNLVGASLITTLVVLTNAFGAVDVAVASICIPLVVGGDFVFSASALLAGWALASPWLPPSLIAQMRGDQFSARGLMGGAGITIGVVALAVIGFVLLNRLTRPLGSGLARFAILFALPMCLIPLAFFWTGVSLIPQGNRYQLELEFALCLGGGCLIGWAWRRRRGLAVLIAVASICILGLQARHYRRAAQSLLEPLDLSQTVEVRNSRWIAQNLPGQRVMLGSRAQYLFNVITDNPQLGGGHEPTSPNWMDKVALYIAYTHPDPEPTVFWLKAFGVQAVETSPLFANPRKFEGVLPVIHEDSGSTIYGIPQRSPSLAHAIPRSAIVSRVPAHGLDTEPARPYVAALDEAPLDIHWADPSHATITGRVLPGQVISVQETWAPGWQANAPVHADGLGLIVIEPNCSGDCAVELTYGASGEAWFCRGLSALALVLITLPSLRKRRSRKAPVAPAG
jgi:hypothetical protein